MKSGQVGSGNGLGSCILRLGGPPIGIRTSISVFPAVKESNSGGHCGGVSHFHESSVHVCHCGVSIVMSLKVLFFKWGHWGITVGNKVGAYFCGRPCLYSLSTAHRRSGLLPGSDRCPERRLTQQYGQRQHHSHMMWECIGQNYASYNFGPRPGNQTNTIIVIII